MTGAEQSLIDRAVAGDRDALGELLEQHGPAVESRLHIGLRWRGLLDAGDVMQVTYIEAFLRVGSFDPARANLFSAWLRRIAENNLRDALSELEAQKRPPPERRVEMLVGGDSYIGLFDLLSAGGGTPSVIARGNETRALIDAALDLLPDDYATAVRLYDLEGRPIDEVATALRRSNGAVHMLRQRGHDRLRELLGTPSKILDTRA